MRLDDFWVQPCRGAGDPRGVGVPESALREIESRAGVALPETFRALLKLQNGGYLRRRSYYDGKQPHQIFINGAEIDRIEAKTPRLRTLQDILEDFMDEDQIQEAADGVDAWHPERLLRFSGLYGHGFAALDYGYRVEAVRAAPEVVVFTQDEAAALGYTETLRAPSFDAFVRGLVYFGYESDDFHFGSTTGLPLDEVARVFEGALGVPLQRRTDDHYGWFDFGAYYSCRHRMGEGVAHSLLSPNRFRSGSHLFQERPEVTCVLRLRPEDGGSTEWSLSANRVITERVLEFVGKLRLPGELKLEPLLMPFC